MCNIRSEDRSSVEQPRNRLKLKTMEECLQNRRTQKFYHLEKNVRECYSVECITLTAGEDFCKGQTRKTWSGVIRRGP